jgi:hydrogenase nickel incorporation protein HypA/HybF
MDMHELSVLKEMIHMVEAAVSGQGVSEVVSIVLQVGELSSIYPDYLRELYPMAAYNTSLEGSTLEVQVIEGKALCHDCNRVFGVVKHDGHCPNCGVRNYEIVGGTEFILKEIVAR